MLKISLAHQKINRQRTGFHNFGNSARVSPHSLDKNPGVRPISVAKSGLKPTASKIGIAAIRNYKCWIPASMYLTWCWLWRISSFNALTLQWREKEAVLLVDAENTFKPDNRKAHLHNFNIIGPSLATFVHHCSF